MFYINPVFIRNGCCETGTKEIYAITNDKKLYKDFKSTRDMKKFELRTLNISKDEYRRLANHHRDCVLEWSSFRSKKKDPYPKDMNESFGNCTEEYKFSITFLEVQSVSEACSTFFEHADITLPNPYIFNKSTRSIFKRLGLEHIFKLTRFPFIGDDAMFCTDAEIARRSNNPAMSGIDQLFLRNEMDFSLPDIWVDQIEVFFEIYGNLMNIT